MKCEQTFILCETSFEKKCFKCWKESDVKVWQSHFKEIIELKTLIKPFMQFFLISDRRRLYKKTLYKKSCSQKFKVFIIKYYDISKIYSA